MTEESSAFDFSGPGQTGPFGRRTWRDELKDRVVSRGIKWVCGASSEVPAAAAADIPIVSGAARFGWLRVLELAGIKTVTATSAFGHPFLCHIGDVAEFPYYHRRALAPELALCSAWLRSERNPVVYDVGANVGYFSTQLVQMASRPLRVVAFEPVPMTFEKLALSIIQLGLDKQVEPVAAAVLQDERTVRIAYSELNSLFSQVTEKQNVRIGNGAAAEVASISLDCFRSRTGLAPVLIKIDVEGRESAVLGGATGILSAAVPPAIILEVSPDMLAECDASLDDLERLLPNHLFYYVDDIVGQRRPYGSRLNSLREVSWTCNVFAIPSLDGYAARCADAFEESRRMLRNVS